MYQSVNASAAKWNAVAVVCGAVALACIVSVATSEVKSLYVSSAVKSVNAYPVASLQKQPMRYSQAVAAEPLQGSGLQESTYVLAPQSSYNLPMPVVAMLAIPAAALAYVMRARSNAKAAAAGFGAAALLAAAPSALAVDVKMGADNGGLVFVPSEVTIKAGESVTWVNNAGYPHNVQFDDDEVPEGVDAGALSHEDLLNAKGDSVSTKFTVPGTYSYHCEPHEGAGMVGKVIVQ